jgi:hypothetical protein
LILALNSSAVPQGTNSAPALPIENSRVNPASLASGVLVVLSYIDHKGWLTIS